MTGIIIDVPDSRVREITYWFESQGLDEFDIVEHSGWLLVRSAYRMEFKQEYRDLAMMFKLALGGL